MRLIVCTGESLAATCSCWVRSDHLIYAVILPSSLLVLNGVVCLTIIVARLFPSAQICAPIRRLMRARSTVMTAGSGGTARLGEKCLALINMQIMLGLPWVGWRLQSPSFEVCSLVLQTLQYFTLFSPRPSVYHYLFTIFNSSQVGDCASDDRSFVGLRASSYSCSSFFDGGARASARNRLRRSRRHRRAAPRRLRPPRLRASTTTTTASRLPICRLDCRCDGAATSGLQTSAASASSTSFVRCFRCRRAPNLHHRRLRSSSGTQLLPWSSKKTGSRRQARLLTRRLQSRLQNGFRHGNRLDSQLA